MHTSSSILVLLGTLTILGALGGFVVLRSRQRGATGEATTTQAASGVPAEAEEATATSTGKRDQRIERVAAAYENGEIDERMLRTAARALGIDKEEARRRLEGAANTHTDASTGERITNRSDVRTKNRKKNKQAKRSRQTNRR